MSEVLPGSPESNAERHTDSNHEKAEAQRGAVKIESAKERSERLEHIRGQIEHEAKNKNKLNLIDSKEHKHTPEARPPINKDLKKTSLRKELSQVRSKLGPTDRLGSKIIHNPLVRSVSEVSSKTISRPSGLLGGGIVAFLGSGAYYYLTKHLGLRYNYLLFTLLFVGGFIVGIIIELGIYTLSSKKTTK